MLTVELSWGALSHTITTAYLHVCLSLSGKSSLRTGVVPILFIVTTPVCVQECLLNECMKVLQRQEKLYEANECLLIHCLCELGVFYVGFVLNGIHIFYRC